MIPINIKRHLQLPLYKLHYIDDLSAFSGLSADEVAAIPEEYSSDVIKGIQEALAWVSQNPTVDLTEAIEGVPYSSDEIRHYLSIVETDLRQIET